MLSTQSESKVTINRDMNIFRSHMLRRVHFIILPIVNCTGRYEELVDSPFIFLGRKHYR